MMDYRMSIHLFYLVKHLHRLHELGVDVVSEPMYDGQFKALVKRNFFTDDGSGYVFNFKQSTDFLSQRKS